MKNAFARLLCLCIIPMTIVPNIVRVNVLLNLAHPTEMKQAVNMVQAQPLTDAAVRAFTAELVLRLQVKPVVNMVLILVPTGVAVLVLAVLLNRQIPAMVLDAVPMLIVPAVLATVTPVTPVMLIPVVLKPIHILTHILARVDISLLLAALRKINSELQIKLVLAAQLPELAINVKIREKLVPLRLVQTILYLVNPTAMLTILLAHL